MYGFTLRQLERESGGQIESQIGCRVTQQNLFRRGRAHDARASSQFASLPRSRAGRWDV